MCCWWMWLKCSDGKAGVLMCNDVRVGLCGEILVKVAECRCYAPYG